MPKLTEARRDARRSEIADGVLRAMARVGFAKLSMADVSAASGLSAGSIYSHFRGKDELAAYVTQRAHQALVDDLAQFRTACVAAGDTVDPAGLTRWMLERISARGALLPALMQLYAESTADPALRRAVHGSLAELRGELEAALADWTSDETAAKGAVEGVLIVCGGYLSRSAMYGEIDVDRYLAALRHVVLPPV